jgi:small subunit ribosomal protein S20
MPNLKASKKDLRQTKQRTERNKLVRDELHTLRRELRLALSGKHADKARELAIALLQKFDKAAQKNIIKRNTAARYKSRMMKKVNALA